MAFKPLRLKYPWHLFTIFLTCLCLSSMLSTSAWAHPDRWDHSWLEKNIKHGHKRVCRELYYPRKCAPNGNCSGGYYAESCRIEGVFDQKEMNKWWRQYCKDVASGARKPENLNFMLGNPCDQFKLEFEMEAQKKAEMEAQMKAEMEAQMKAMQVEEAFAEVERGADKECESKLTPSKKKQIQIALIEEVGYSGPIDGNLDGSREAIKAWQKKTNTVETGYVGCEQDKKLIFDNMDAIMAYADKQKKIEEAFAEIERGADKECESKLTPSKKIQVQIALSEEVGYSGPIDGNLDGSREAIKAWQKNKKFVETGYVGCEQDQKLTFDNMDAIMAYADKQIEVSKKAAEELAAAQKCEAELNESKKKQLQVALTSENYDRAAIDGNLDESREAIKAWQSFNGHNETGYLKCEHIKSIIAENIDKVMEYATGEIEVAQKTDEEADKAEKEAERIAEENDLRCEVPAKYAEFQPYIEADVAGKTVDEFVETVRGYLDRRQLRKLQRTLKDHPRRSYYRSTIDGLWGKGTKKGVLDWIEEENPKYRPDYVITKADTSCLIRDIAIAVEKSEQAQRAAEQAAAAAQKKKATAQTQQKNANTNSDKPANVLGNVNTILGTVKQIQGIGGLLGGGGNGSDDHPEEDPNTALICDDNGVCRPQN